jgi:hypothetical protein
MCALTWQVKYMIVLRNILVLSHSFHRLLVDLHIVGRTVRKLRITKFRLVEVPEVTVGESE